MPSIGELFVTLGAKTDSSMAEGLRKLQELGATAQKMTAQLAAAARGSAGAASEFSAMGRAMKSAAMDASLLTNGLMRMADKQVEAAKRVARAQAEAARVAMLGRGGKQKPSNLDWGSIGDPFNPSGQQADIKAASRARVAAFKALGDEEVEAKYNAAVAHSESLKSFRTSLKSRMESIQNSPDWASARGNIFGGLDWGAGGDPFAAGGARNETAGGMGGGGGAAPPGRRGRGTPGGRGGAQRGGGFNSRFGALGDVSGLRRVILGAGIYQGVQYLTQISDSYTNITNRLHQVTSSQEELNSTFDRLRDISLRTRSALNTTSEAYVRIRLATGKLHLSQDDQFKLIERINMAFKTSGATTAEASSGMIQLTQAFNKGKLDGDEFRTMAEEMPGILKALATVMKVPEEQLFKLSKQGKLTREVLVKAFLTNEDIEKNFANTKATFRDQWENLKTQITKPIGEALGSPEVQNAVKVVFEALANVIVFLAKILPPVVSKISAFVKGLADGKPWAIGLAIVLGTMLIPQLIAMVAWMTRLAAMPFTSIAGQFTKLRALAGGDLAGAGVGGFFGGGPAAKATGAAEGAAAGSTAASGGILAALPVIGQVIAAAYLLNEATGGSMSYSKQFHGFGSDDMYKAYFNKKGIDTGSVGGPPTNQVSVGPTTVNIYAQDMKDAQEMFSQEMMDRMLRHAAGNTSKS